MFFAVKMPQNFLSQMKLVFFPQFHAAFGGMLSDILVNVNSLIFLSEATHEKLPIIKQTELEKKQNNEHLWVKTNSSGQLTQLQP